VEVDVDAERFDRLVESLSRSGDRRDALRTLTGAILGAAGLGALAGDDAAGRNRGKSKRRGNRKERGSVRAQAASCCSTGNCTPGAGKNLAKCCYEGQNLAGKNFRGANLGNANFSGATLTNANFSSANLDRACFVDANLTGARLGGANTGTAIFCRTTMPDGSVNNSGCNKGTACCQTCVEIGEPRCAIGGSCCGGAECTGSGDGICACPAGETDCSGVCVDLQTDEPNCGACGRACPAGETCRGGDCQCGDGDTCAVGLTCCNGSCVNLLTDLDNCTECGNVCPRPLANATVECGPGFDEDDRPGYGCTYMCQSNYRDCDGDPLNGCERAIFNDPNNCGDCDNTCPAGSPRCCGCKCFESLPPNPPVVPCSTCQPVGNARLIRRR
jgi:hypothetical protein